VSFESVFNPNLFATDLTIQSFFFSEHTGGRMKLKFLPKNILNFVARFAVESFSMKFLLFPTKSGFTYWTINTIALIFNKTAKQKA
jgi:hypothetical protein